MSGTDSRVPPKIRLGISACLLGENVRYDGGHKRDQFLTDVLGRHVEYVPVCPEVECGFSIPREPVCLTGDPDSPRLIAMESKQDHTDRILRWARNRVAELENEGLWGFVFKSKSPSCGLENVEVCNERGVPAGRGVGLFARAFMDRFPLLPVEEERSLYDLTARDGFLERIFVCKRWRELVARKKNRQNLEDFHTKHDLLILSHSPEHHRALGKLVAGADETPVAQLHSRYRNLLLQALGRKNTRGKNSRVLRRIIDLLKKQLSPDERRELLDAVEHYGRGDVPLIVPITLLNHHARKLDNPHLKDQYYLHPDPVEIRLRYHA